MRRFVLLALISGVLVTAAVAVGARSVFHSTNWYGENTSATSTSMSCDKDGANAHVADGSASEADACLGDGAAVAGATEADACGDEGATVAGATEGKPTGNNDTVMSAICRQACATKIAYQEDDLAVQPGAMDEDLTRCPVSGVVFAVGPDNPTIAFKGGNYRLCCVGCEKKFKANPARFVAS